MKPVELVVYQQFGKIAPIPMWTVLALTGNRIGIAAAHPDKPGDGRDGPP